MSLKDEDIITVWRTTSGAKEPHLIGHDVDGGGDDGGDGSGQDSGDGGSGDQS
jgi:hypothetical protein